MMFLAVLLLTMAWPSSPLELDKGAVFLKEEEILMSGDRWIVTTDIDLGVYWTVLNKFANMLGNVSVMNYDMGNETTQETKTRINNLVSRETDIISRDVINLKQKFGNLIQTITPYNGRQKRGLLNIGGRVLNILFGTADDLDLEAINTKINKQHKNQEKITNIIKEQVTIIKSLEENNYKINENLDKMKSVQSMLNTKIDKVSKIANYNLERKIVQSMNLNSAIRTIEYILNDLKENVIELETALEITALKKLSPAFINPSTILAVLKSIQDKLPTGLSLVTNYYDRDVYLYYDICIVHAAYYNEKLRIFVEIPLKAHGRYFTLYRALPLPYLANNSEIRLNVVTDYTYLGMSSDGQYYLELNIEDLVDCHGEEIKICPPTKAIRKIRDLSCLPSLFIGDTKFATEHCTFKISSNEKSIFYRARNSNQWLYSVHRDVIRFNCPNDMNNALLNSTSKIITGTGILDVSPACTVHGPDYILLSHSTTKSRISTAIYDMVIPPLDTNIGEISKFSKLENYDIEKVLNQIDTKTIKAGISIEEWSRHIDNLKEDEEAQKFKINSGCTVVAILVIIIITYCGIKYRRRIKKICIKEQKPSNNQALEMQLMGSQVEQSVPPTHSNETACCLNFTEQTQTF